MNEPREVAALTALRDLATVPVVPESEADRAIRHAEQVHKKALLNRQLRNLIAIHGNKS